MSEAYTREKLGNAVYSLATSPDTIQKRIHYAWTAMHTLKEGDFEDPENRSSFVHIMDTLTAYKLDEVAGWAGGTTSRLTDRDAAAIAAKIVELNDMLITADSIWMQNKSG